MQESVEFFDNPQTAAKISRIKEAKSLYVYRGATLFPWKLVAHVLRDALHKGLNLQTTTPATEVRPGQKGTWDVVTPRGIINCKQVVHATNAYSAVLLPEFRNIIHPTPHLVHRVIPPTSFSGSKVLDASYHVICSDHAIHSVNARSTSDGSILFGGANPGYQNLRDWVASDRQNMLNDNIASWHSIRKEVIDMSSKQLWPEVDMTPQKAQQIYVSSWSGILARSVDGMPFIGPVSLVALALEASDS